MEKSTQMIHGIICPKQPLTEEAQKYRTLVIIKMILLVPLVIVVILLLLFVSTKVIYPYDSSCLILSIICFFAGLHYFCDFLSMLDTIKFVCLDQKEQKAFEEKLAHEYAQAKYQLFALCSMKKEADAVLTQRIIKFFFKE